MYFSLHAYYNVTYHERKPVLYTIILLFIVVFYVTNKTIYCNYFCLIHKI